MSASLDEVAKEYNITAPYFFSSKSRLTSRLVYAPQSCYAPSQSWKDDVEQLNHSVIVLVVSTSINFFKKLIEKKRFGQTDVLLTK